MNISFVKFIDKNFENMLALMLMSSFSVRHIKQWVKTRANVNLRQYATSATDGIKHNTRKKLTYEFHFLLKI